MTVEKCRHHSVEETHDDRANSSFQIPQFLQPQLSEAWFACGDDPIQASSMSDPDASRSLTNITLVPCSSNVGVTMTTCWEL